MEAPREHCYVCDKVACLCICGRVPSVSQRTKITIVQHRRERRHPFGTVRIARMGLSNVGVHVVGREAAPLRPPAGAAVLFPDPSAPLLSSLPPGERPDHLVVIDGTWGHAAQLRRDHPALASLPSVRLAPEAPSRYRIRKEPHARAVSTLEAIVCALRILEPETEGLDALLSSFDAMIDDQLERRGAHPSTPRHRHAPRIKKPLPDVLRAETGDIALVHAEVHQPRGQQQRFALRVTAARPRPRQVFDALVQTPIPASPARVRNMELGRDPLDASLGPALDPAALVEELRALFRETDTLVAWSAGPGRVLRELGFAQPFVSVKHHYANQADGRVGALGDVVAALGAAPIEAWAPGRAGRELAQLDRVVRAMRARADAPD